MRGKRERKKNVRWPGVLSLTVVLVALLSQTGLEGVGMASHMIPPRHTQELPLSEALSDTAPAAEETASVPAPALPMEEPDAAEEPVWGPVAKSDAAEDTYFSDAVFLGDSRTEGFSLYSGLKEGKFLYGVGATVESVFSKDVWKMDSGGKVPLLDALKTMECGKVYVMLGVNELGWNRVETFYNQYARVVDRIREDHPDAQIVLQSILPVSAKQDAKKSYVNNGRITAFNEAVMDLAEEKGCFYVNVAEAVMGEDGCLRPELTFDGVHLNVDGCRIWLHYLRTHTI